MPHSTSDKSYYKNGKYMMTSLSTVRTSVNEFLQLVAVADCGGTQQRFTELF